MTATPRDKVKRRLLICGFAGVVALAVSPARALTLLDDQFADNNRTEQSPPSSVHWFGTAGGSNFTMANNQLTLALGGSGRGAVAYFLPEGETVTLSAVGDVLTFMLEFLVDPLNTTTSADTFRMGLFNTHDGVRVNADNQGNAYSGYGGVEAYAAGLTVNSVPSNPARAEAPISIVEKNIEAAASLGSFGTGNANYPQLGVGGPAGVPFLEAATGYTASFILQRTGESELTLTASMTGGSLEDFTFTAIDAIDPVFSFDGIGFQMISNTFNSITISRAVVEFAPVPEPSTWAMLLGGIYGAFLFKRRLSCG